MLAKVISVGKGYGGELSPVEAVADPRRTLFGGVDKVHHHGSINLIRSRDEAMRSRGSARRMTKPESLYMWWQHS